MWVDLPLYPQRLSMTEAELLLRCDELAEQARSTQQRRLLVLSGSHDWAHTSAEAWVNRAVQRKDNTSVCWVTACDDDLQLSSKLKVIQPGKHQALLGAECDHLVFDAHTGLHPDALGAACGAVKGGGLLLLLTPPLTQWPDFPDPDYQRLAVWPVPAAQVRGQFLRWLSQSIMRDPHLMLVEEKKPLPAVSPVERIAPSPWREDDSGCRTDDQLQAVTMIERVALGHRHRPLVVRSDRGRGKSTALGIAAANLLCAGKQTILVCAPRRTSAQSLFIGARRHLRLEGQTGDIEWQGREIRFFAPDELLHQCPSGDLLLVDEAAAIPSPLLEAMLDQYPRIVFATTIHGYEGSGRGFALRFQKVLQQRTPDWQAITLEQPIRWAAQDPVENWCFEALLLNADYELHATSRDASSLKVELVSQAELIASPEMLRQLFGLLVMAHYRTSPSDLRHLLDGPNLKILLLRQGAEILGAALLALEGGFDEPLSRDIWLGRRRPRGHLLPQSLAAHGGLLQAPLRHCARVVRIAVHPQCQGQGHGSRLLAELESHARALGCDYLGSSFGVTAQLLPFWLRAGLKPLRLGISRDASSGTYSVMVGKGLSDAGQQLIEQSRRRFAREFPQQLGEHYGELDADLVSLLLSSTDTEVTAADELDHYWLDLISFAEGNRLYETCSVPLRQALEGWLERSRLVPMEAREEQLLFGKVLQQQSWKSLAALYPGEGRRQLQQRLRMLYSRQLDLLLPERFYEFRSAVRN
ncbi:GNAT family N-acetyltransferase [Aestuariirhabdus sp. Z084]|uniref:tRNA(Met) cytidine acetyltransferase TmcA n=1 Tax=Aestuariirhabdus haliotis TaxID=2918751 RepID=UPI00201B40EA|nr:GNAT family N-acetyltransferase [Aestuariirhabdus haliotis]MCL6417452.1 GNAT family N-acetyltransferase [Aestuariirhabdus haliotis]MCL6421396.1 GNAT family N-acetyltransferase [Aestuariirhabdus haliotis]